MGGIPEIRAANTVTTIGYRYAVGCLDPIAREGYLGPLYHKPTPQVFPGGTPGFTGRAAENFSALSMLTRGVPRDEGVRFGALLSKTFHNAGWLGFWFLYLHEGE